jgi:ABC-type glycerol-3-phosphate transport system substrate-binding protein
MRSKSLLVLPLILLLLLPSAAAFAGGQKEGKEQQPVELAFSFWGWGNEIELKQKIIQGFEAQEPLIKIKGSFTDGETYPAKLQTYFSSNTAPDVISIAGDILSEFVAQGVFADLAGYLQKNKLLSGTWPKASVDAFRYKGTIVATPFVFKIPAIVYNKSLFDQAGLAYPKNDWTEDELLDLAKKLTRGEGVNKQFGFNLSFWPYYITRGLLGEHYYDIQNRKMKAVGNKGFRHALQLFADMIAKYQVSPDDTAAKAIGGGFETGKFAMALTGTFDMPTYQKVIGDKFAWDVVMLPTNKEFGPWKGNLFVDGFGLSAKTPHKDRAWRFISYMSTDVSSQKIASGIGIPALSSYANSQEYLGDFPAGWKPYNKKAFVDMLDRSFIWETTGVWAKINDELDNQFKMLVAGKVTVDQVLQNMDQKGAEYLKSD